MIATAPSPTDADILLNLQERLLATVQRAGEEHAPFIGLSHAIVALRLLADRLEDSAALETTPLQGPVEGVGP